MTAGLVVAQISPVLLVVILAVGIVLWFALRPRYDFTITVKGGDVKLEGKLPAIQRAAITQFFLSDVPAAGAIRVRGRRVPRGPLRLSIDGELSAGDRQRIRNFLGMHV